MGVAADIVTLLRATAAVANLCVTNPKTSTKAIRPDRLSQTDVLTGSLCGIEVSTNGNEYQNDLSGSSKSSLIRVLVDCVALNSTAANAVADQVENVLEPYRGATAGGTINAVDLIDRREDWATNEDGTDVGECIVEIELSVFYIRS